MAARWSLRTKLVVVVILALLPVVAVVGWQIDSNEVSRDGQRVEAAASVLQLAVARDRELIESARRVLTAVCAENSVSESAAPDASQAELSRCGLYLARVLEQFPDEYSAALVTDDKGVARCSSAATVVGMGFGDREVFRSVRDSSKFAVGSYVASRVTPISILPVALPIQRNGNFGGMCAMGISRRWLADAVTAVSPDGEIAVVLIDHAGAAIGGNADFARMLPRPGRAAAAVALGESTFRDYGRDGSLHDFSIRPLSATTGFVVAITPVVEGLFSWTASGRWLALMALAVAAMLLAVWLGVDFWVERPLRRIRDFIDNVGRDEARELGLDSRWSPELTAVGTGVKAMAEAIASREAELKAGLEQRDHMLREIHHRVKNNLQMISSLLNLQAGEIRSPRIRRFFGDAQNRVLTLSILHRHLYERSSWSLVDFQRFISDLVRQISVGRHEANIRTPRFLVRAPTMAVGPDTAIPIGLIVTEVVSRALDHGFEGVAAPEIRIEAVESGGEVTILIEDNGSSERGGSLRPEGRGEFGLTLIRGLAMQLGGVLSIEAREDGGMRVTVTFPLPKEEAFDA
jgi:two-component sensor histidine kinase